MEPIRYVNIASFSTGPEAHVARNELEAAGIPAQVTGEAAVSALWYVGTALGGVKLMVAEKDVPAARKILVEAALAAAPLDDSFDGYDAVEDEQIEGDDTESPPGDADEALASRIWRSAVFGLFICPPLVTCYSMVLLLANLDIFGRISPEHKWKLWAALCVNLAFVGLLGLATWSTYFAVNYPSYGPPDAQPLTREYRFP